MKINKNKELTEKATKNKKIDGRSATRTGRIVQFATSVTVDFDNAIRQLAREDNLMIVQVLEKSLELYKKQRVSVSSEKSEIRSKNREVGHPHLSAQKYKNKDDNIERE